LEVLSIFTQLEYDLEIVYHPGKANVVVDAMSRKRMGAAPG